MLSWWSHWRAKDAYTRASLCNTPVLTSFVLKVHYVYIVINHGAELKTKAPPSICCDMFRRLESLPMVYHDIWNILVWASCKYAFLIK